MQIVLTLNEQLYQRVVELAKQLNKDPAELGQEALEHYLDYLARADREAFSCLRG